MKRALLVVSVLAAAGLAGCLGDDKETTDDALERASTPTIDEKAQQRLLERASVVKDYVIPGQKLLEPVTVFFNSSIDVNANVAYEDRNDRGGTNYNTYIIESDVSRYLPPGQPAEMQVTLWYFGGLGATADLDLYVNVPGMETHYADDNNDEMNWKVSVQRMTVNTVGVAGADHIVGVQVTNGRTAPGESMDYALRVEFRYPNDALTPVVPYGITVPADATGIILESVKAGGDEHVRAEFVLVGPDDNLVGYFEYDDLAIPTESIFIPVNAPGEYVFYAYRMEGGFLHARSDAALDTEAGTEVVRILSRVEERVVDFAGPAPGMVERNPGCLEGVCSPTPTPYAEGTRTSFQTGSTFPLDVAGWFGGDGPRGTLGSEIRISSSKGLVFSLHRVARYDDERGSIGYTNDRGTELFMDRTKLARGDYTVSIVNDGDVEVGHTLVTYRR